MGQKQPTIPQDIRDVPLIGDKGNTIDLAQLSRLKRIEIVAAEGDPPPTLYQMSLLARIADGIELNNLLLAALAKKWGVEPPAAPAKIEVPNGG